MERQWQFLGKYLYHYCSKTLNQYAWDVFSSIYLSHPEVVHAAGVAHSHGASLVLSNSKLLDSLGVGILLASVGLKEWFFQATMKIARKTDSSVLKANAWHHRVDALTAIVALVGLSGRVGFDMKNDM